MACLGSVLYDPGTVATVSSGSLLAMSIMDTTNARITFTCPANGTVLVKLRVATKGSTSVPTILLGVLDGATVRGRQLPIQPRQEMGTIAGQLRSSEAVFLVTGLTPSNSYTWDAAYAVQVAFASSLIGWGGPNNTSTADAYGALDFEIWETTNLLAGTMYDPGTADVSHLTSAATVLAAFDTTNLRLNFTVPASGRVLVRMRTMGFGSATAPPVMHLGVLEGATVRGRQHAHTFVIDPGANAGWALQSEFVVGGLTPAANLNWDAAWGVENVVASTKIGFGGPNNNSGANAYGGFAYEIWSA